MTNTINYKNAYWSFMRGNRNAYVEIELGRDDSGNHITPDEFSEKFSKSLAENNVFRRLGRVIRTTASDMKVNAVVTTGNAEWVQDGMDIPDCTDTFTNFGISSYKLAALARVNNSFINDYQFNLESYLTREFAGRFQERRNQPA